MAYDGIMMSAVTKELNETILRGRVNKLYIISKYEMLMNIRSFHKTYKLLISIHPTYARIQLTNLSFPTSNTPSSLTMLYRKYLEGAYIESIEQIQLDRILHITFIGTNELRDTVKYHLYIEIMGKHSNCTLTFDSMKIIDSLKRISPSQNSVRFLQPGAQYILPPLISKKDPFSDKYNNEPLIKTFMGFSKDLANEVEYRLNTQTFESIMDEIKNSHSLFIHRIKDKEIFHLIELKHLNASYKEYPLTDGLDIHFDDLDQKDRIKQQTHDLEKYIHNEYTKNVNKLSKLEKTLFDSENSDIYRIKGDLLFSSLHLIEKGMKSVEVDNYYDNTKMVIDLDEKLSGKDNAKKYYNKYQKAKNSINVLNEQIQLTKEEISYFDTLITQMKHASYYDAIEIKEELENLGYIRKKKNIRKKESKVHFESYLTKDDIPLFIGKNNLQNDYLTFKFAKKNDYWFHVKDMPGSHVIVKSENLDEYTIRLAANIAAYYSKGQTSSSVPVNYTQIKTLKKAKGNKPGQVLLSNYSTIYIDPDDSFKEELKSENKKI